jgi:hypothetical protein
MDHFPNLPKDPTPTPPPPTPGTGATAKARAAKGFNLMYVWIGLAVAGFGAIAYWGMLRPKDSEALSPESILVPGTQTAEQRAEEQALTNMVRRMREQQEASRVLVLEGPRNPDEPADEQKPASARGAKEMIIKFTPAQPSTRPATIGGRTKPFLAPDVAEDGSFFGQIDKATGKPKTVYSSNLGKYLVDNGVDFAERDASGAVIDDSSPAPADTPMPNVPGNLMGASNFGVGAPAPDSRLDR